MVEQPLDRFRGVHSLINNVEAVVSAAAVWMLALDETVGSLARGEGEIGQPFVCRLGRTP